MRKHLADDFDALYILDLGGNVRKELPSSRTTTTSLAFEVGVSINLSCKEASQGSENETRMFFCQTRTMSSGTRGRKLHF